VKKAAAGYSKSPLAKKLGIAEGSKVFAKNSPAAYAQLLEPLPPRVVFQTKLTKDTDVVHVFSDRRSALATELGSLRLRARADAVVWISWPKKASKVATDITEDTIRQIALPLGFVDVKVCAIDNVWSGLKLVVRKELR
jgi:hypothetical protein